MLIAPSANTADCAFLLECMTARITLLRSFDQKSRSTDQYIHVKCHFCLLGPLTSCVYAFNCILADADTQHWSINCQKHKINTRPKNIKYSFLIHLSKGKRMKWTRCRGGVLCSPLACGIDMTYYRKTERVSQILRSSKARYSWHLSCQEHPGSLVFDKRLSFWAWEKRSRCQACQAWVLSLLLAAGRILIWKLLPMAMTSVLMLFTMWSFFHNRIQDALFKPRPSNTGSCTQLKHLILLSSKLMSPIWHLFLPSLSLQHHPRPMYPLHHKLQRLAMRHHPSIVLEPLSKLLQSLWRPYKQWLKLQLSHQKCINMSSFLDFNVT